MTKRIRVIRYHVQPELVIDDGENLYPLDVQSVRVNASDWERFVSEELAKGIAALEAQHCATDEVPLET